jgi:hypothetical protein
MWRWSALALEQLHSFWVNNHKPNFTFYYVLSKKVPAYRSFGFILLILEYGKLFLFLFSLSTRCINFGATCLVYKFPLKMHRNVTYYAHIMLQISLNVRRLPWRLASRTSYGFLSVRFEDGPQRSKSKNPCLATFGNANVWVPQRSYNALSTHTHTCTSVAQKNGSMCYSDNNHTYSQYITSAVPSDTQHNYTWLALHAASRKTSGSHM